MINILAEQTVRIGHPILGYILPAVIFIGSFFVALEVYKHFSKQLEEQKSEK